MTSGLSPKTNGQVTRDTSANASTSGSLFSSIPPERVGLNGEYDHSGLAKRVMLAFCNEFSTHEIASIRVTQRGRVVVLVGKVATQRLLNSMVEIALRVSGAADVETYGVKVEATKFTPIEAEPSNSRFYAC
jgi:hypothetical protein